MKPQRIRSIHISPATYIRDRRCTCVSYWETWSTPESPATEMQICVINLFPTARRYINPKRVQGNAYNNFRSETMTITSSRAFLVVVSCSAIISNLPKVKRLTSSLESLSSQNGWLYWLRKFQRVIQIIMESYNTNVI